MSSNFDTYAGLRDTIYTWLDCTSGDIATAVMDDLVRIGQRRIEKGGSILMGDRTTYIPGIRCRQNEKALSVALSGGVAPIPSDYLELKQAYMVIGGVTLKLDRTETDMIYRRYPVRANNGNPVLIARDGDNFVFGPVPSSGTLIGTYYRSFPDVTGTTLSLTDSNSSDYNKLYSFCPEAYLLAALIEAEPLLMRDGRQQVWNQKYISVVDGIDENDRKERFSGSPLSVRIQ